MRRTYADVRLSQLERGSALYCVRWVSPLPLLAFSRCLVSMFPAPASPSFPNTSLSSICPLSLSSSNNNLRERLLSLSVSFQKLSTPFINLWLIYLGSHPTKLIESSLFCIVPFLCGRSPWVSCALS